MKVEYRTRNNPTDDFDIEVDLDMAQQLISDLKLQTAQMRITVSDKISLDFYVEGDGTIWMEIYQPNLYTSAFVTKRIAEQVLNAAVRDFDGQDPVDCLPALEDI